MLTIVQAILIEALARWVIKIFKSDECDAHKRPYARRLAAVPKSYRMNQVVGLDLVEVKDPFDGTPHF